MTTTPIKMVRTVPQERSSSRAEQQLLSKEAALRDTRLVLTLLNKKHNHKAQLVPLPKMVTILTSKEL